MSKDAPWNPAAVIANYGAMVLRGETYRVEAVESFLKAVRAAQPFRLPPDDGKGWPKRMKLVFSLDSL